MRARSGWIAAVAVSLVGALLLTRGASLDDLDGANFQHALHTFDLALHMPHFPGYPVYVAASRAALSLVGDEVLALQLPGLLGWVGALVMLWTAVRHHLGERTATFAAAIAALAPLTWLTAGRTGSDALGLALLTGTLAALALATPSRRVEATATSQRAWGALAGLLAGLTLGARLSYAPALFGGIGVFIVQFVLSRRSPTAEAERTPGVAMGPSPRHIAAAFVVGLLVWVVPFGVLAGPELFERGASFLTGHFTAWGGTAFLADGSGGGLWTRSRQWTEHLLVHGLVFPVAGASLLRWLVGPALLAAILTGLGHLDRRTLALAALLTGPYLAWLVLGQNPDKPRHLLPLIPLLAVIAGIGLARWPGGPALAACAALGAITVSLAATHATTPSAPAQLASWLAESQDPHRVRLFTGQSERVVGALAPEYRVEYAADLVEAERRLARFPSQPPVLLWTSELDDDCRAPAGYGPPIPLATFSRDPLVNPHRPSLTVWTAEPLQAVVLTKVLP